MVTLMGSGTSNGFVALTVARTPRQRLRENLAAANLVAVLAVLLATFIFSLHVIPLLAYVPVVAISFAMLMISGCIFYSWDHRRRH